MGSGLILARDSAKAVLQYGLLYMHRWGRIKSLIEPQTVVACLFVCYFLGFAYGYLKPTLFRTWFFSSDEYVLAAEIIRFSQFDFHQHFFDNPGTFFMLLNTPGWLAFYGFEAALGLTKAQGIGAFTIQHIATLFVLMRATTVLCFLLSAVLLFALGTKLMNAGAGAIAALLLLMSPVYNGYSSFSRTESLAMVCMLAAALILIYGTESSPGTSPDDTGRFWFPEVAAGICVGLAAGARLHSLVASIPTLVILLWIRKPYRKNLYPAWIVKTAKILLPASWIVTLALMPIAQKRFILPAALHFVIIAGMGWILLSAAAFAGYFIPRTRPAVVAIFTPNVIKLAIGCIIGFLIGNFTVLRQYNYFLGSVQSYNGYRDFDRMNWSFLTNATWYVKHYLAIVAPDAITAILLGTGALLVLITRNRNLIPFLIGAAAFFVSKPLTLIAAPHHVILWLPFFYLVCAYPAGYLLNLLERSVPGGQYATAMLLALGLYTAFHALTPGPELAASSMLSDENRLHNIEHATQWIKTNAEPKATVAISYFCFNPDAFLGSLRSLEVPFPEPVSDNRKYLVWWGYARDLKNKSGYVCLTPSDVESIKTKLDLTEPGQGTNPYNDPRFTRVVSFGSGSAAEVDLFHFDYR